MKKYISIFLLIILYVISTYNAGTSSIDNNTKEIMSKKALNYIELKRYDRELNLFIDLMGYDESRHDWDTINAIGCFGEYQFKQSTLKHLGYGHITKNKFKKDRNIFPPELQREAMIALIESNTVTMQKWIDEYQWTIINGVIITKAGILAGCHLGGPASVKKYLASNGAINKSDLFKTSVETYIRRYQGFNLNKINYDIR